MEGRMPETPVLGLGSLVSGLREVYRNGRTRELAWRRSQLKGLISLLTEKEEDIFDALRNDLGKHRTEAFRDEVVVQSLRVRFVRRLAMFFPDFCCSSTGRGSRQVRQEHAAKPREMGDSRKGKQALAMAACSEFLLKSLIGLLLWLGMT
jgi:hypothetical protein